MRGVQLTSVSARQLIVLVCIAQALVQIGRSLA